MRSSTSDVLYATLFQRGGELGLKAHLGIFVESPQVDREKKTGYYGGRVAALILPATSDYFLSQFIYGCGFLPLYFEVASCPP